MRIDTFMCTRSSDSPVPEPFGLLDITSRKTALDSRGSALKVVRVRAHESVCVLRARVCMLSKFVCLSVGFLLRKRKCACF